MFRGAQRFGRFGGCIGCAMALSSAAGLVPAAEAADAPGEGALARRALEATGVKGGLIVHVGSGEGRLTAALRASDSYLVHGLEADAARVQAARRHLRSLGVYRKVAVDRLTGPRLPYIDNLVNLLVAEDLGEVPMREVLRVLAPRGVAYVREGEEWVKTVKPRPREIDEWTHYLHDASNNAVARDSVVGPPRRLQWVGSPRWSRHHDRMASMSALVSAGGRIFYIFDEGPTASVQLPSKWSLIARDAFNGTVLWKRSIASWHTHLWPFKSGPAQLPRRLVAVGERVYVTLGREAPLTALDAATGRTVRTYDGTRAAEEVLAAGGDLFLLVNEDPQHKGYRPVHRNVGQAKSRVARGWPWDRKERQIVAARAETGEVLWKKKVPVVPLTLAADAGGVFFHDGERVVRLDRATGEQAWRSEAVGRRSPIPTCFGPTLVVVEDVVLFAGGNRSMTALSAKTGKTLWKAPHPRGGHNSPEDLLVVDGLAWAGAVAGGRDSGLFTGRDLRTGQVKRQFPPGVKTYWFHHRCYRSKATERYLLPSRTGIEFVDVRKKDWTIHHWVRGGCLYGVMPCNGLVYAPPHDCACYIISKLYGFNALAPAGDPGRPPGKVSEEDRLERGPAYSAAAEAAPPGQADWPTYRHDPARSGFTRTPVPAELKRTWQADLGGTLSSVVVAGGKLFVAGVEAHTVHALDAASGQALWSYTAGGRVDSPPTVYQGRVLFGSADGSVYCLRGSDGKLMWRFRAAPADKRLAAFEQLESVWPAHGSVLVEGGVVYCLAGRSMFLDGGMRLCRLDPKTGGKLSETVLDHRDPKTGKGLQAKIRGLNMPAALPDVLSSDGRCVYMRSQRFDLAGKRTEIVTPADPARQAGEGAHLFGTTGFLDGTWFHRSYWMFGKTPLSGAGGYYKAGQYAPAGRILVFDESCVYGYGRRPEYFRWTTPMEYHLFAAGKSAPTASAPAGASKPARSAICVGNSESLNPAGKCLAVEAWVRAAKADGVILARGGGAHGYVLFLTGGRPRFAVRVNRKLHAVAAREEVVGKWTHLAGVLTAEKKLQIYVNGELAGSAKAGGFIAQDPKEAMEIGSDDGSSVGDDPQPVGLTGIVDEVKIYHGRVLPDEVKAHYQGAAGKDGAARLVLYYSFDTGDARDESGNKNHGAVGAKPAQGKSGRGMSFTGRRPPRRSRTPTRRPGRIAYRWSQEVPLHVRAMVLAGGTLFIAGPPDLLDEEEVFTRHGRGETRPKLLEQAAALAGKRGALLRAVAAGDGEKLAEYKLAFGPVWDGLAAADGRLYLATIDGKVLCFAGK